MIPWMRLSSVVFVAACGSGPPHSGGQAHHHPSFDDPEMWSKRFDDPARDEWQKPDVVVRHLTLGTDSVVADIGCGTGYFAMRLWPLVPVGKVYAVDVERSMVDYTQKRLEAAGAANVVGIVAAADDPRLPGRIDAALVVDTYHHIGDRARYFAKVREHLNPGGRVLIVEYKSDPAIPGPPAAMRLLPDQVIAEMAQAGYTLSARSEGLLPRQYLLLFTPR